jgi:copper(I)-binding protein
MKALVLVLLVMLSVPANAHEIKAGSLIIIHPTVDEAEKGQNTARGSMEIRNEGSSTDNLLSLKAEFAEKVIIETPGEVIVSSSAPFTVSRR